MYRTLSVLLFLCCAWPWQTVHAQQMDRCPDYYLSPQERIGINVAREQGKEITDYPVTQLGAGWYLDYTWHDEPAHPNTTAPPGQMAYMPMVRPTRFLPSARNGVRREIQPAELANQLRMRLSTAIANNPGATWLLGNEPDNWDQDRQYPDDYAIFYHMAYTTIKALDPTARIAMAPITQVTPLRLRYLEEVLTTYETAFGEPLPVDVWTVHAYILPETGPQSTEGAAVREEVSWGIGIPPGLEAYQEEALYFAQEQHDDLHLFADQIVRFRAWLAEHNYRETPLYVTEYGVLLSPHHGFDAERVERFFLGSKAFLQQAYDAETGYPPDANRLVQRWAWFSLNFYAFDPTPGVPHGLEGLNGNLFDHGSGAITPLGETFAAFGERLHTRTVDLAVHFDPNHPQQLTVANRGDATADGFRLRLWWGEDVLDTVTIATPVQAHCGNFVPVGLQWQVLPGAMRPPLRVQVLPALGQVEYDARDN